MDIEARKKLRKKFAIAIAASGVVLAMEVGGGIWTNSLALLSDAGHVFMDFLALALTYLAIVWAERPPTSSKTYGYHRLEIFAAFFNGISIAAIAVMIFVDAYHRLLKPEPVKSMEMFIIAAVGLLANLAVAALLMRSREESLNVRSAFLHVIGDALASVGVIIGGIVMLTTEWYYADPIVSVAIGGIIVIGGWRVVRESFHILIEGTPTHLDLDEVINTIRRIPDVCRVHDFHLWCLSSHVCALSAHIVVVKDRWDNVPEIMKRIEHELGDHFNIHHTTLQFEVLDGQTEQVLCDIVNTMPKDNHANPHNHKH